MDGYQDTVINLKITNAENVFVSSTNMLNGVLYLYSTTDILMCTKVIIRNNRNSTNRIVENALNLLNLFIFPD